MIYFAILFVPGLLFLIFVVTQFLFRGRREINAAIWRKEGRCTHCGYQLQGNMSGVCPECGKAIEGGETI